MSKKKGFGKFLAGVGIGAGLGILFAPKKGSETRRELKQKLNEMLEKAKNVDIEEVKQNIETKIEEIKEELSDLDKAKQWQEKAQDLVDYAIEKGTPVLEKTAASIKEKTIEVTKEILNKLEETDNK